MAPQRRGYEEEGNRTICGYLQVIPDDLKSFLKRKAQSGDTSPFIFFASVNRSNILSARSEAESASGGSTAKYIARFTSKKEVSMCGIFAVVGKSNNAGSIVFNGLRDLEYRGYDSWGIAQDTDSGLIINKSVGKLPSHSPILPKSSIAIGHTRWATHGGVTQANAHPHFDCDKTTAIIHNGIIENYQNLKNKLDKQGHRFVSETDSEVVAHLLETTTFRHTFRRLTGLNAVISLQHLSGQIIAARHGSPLVVGFAKDANYLASDALALEPFTTDIYYLEDDQMAILTASQVKIVDVATGHLLHPRHQRLVKTGRTSLGHYPNFMIKEIIEQPQIINQITAVSTGQHRQLAKLISQSFGSYLIGCGSASYVCLAGTYLFSKISHHHLNWAIGSEFGYCLDFLTPKSLVIALSQSGETMDILESVKAAQTKGAKILSLVNVVNSSLDRLADYRLPLGAGPEKAVASTKALTAMLSHLILLAYCSINQQNTGQKILKSAALSSRRLLLPKSIKKFQQLAQHLKDKSHIFVIGRGLSYPASLETAIKIKEISYIHAEGLAAGELKHGPLALVESGTPCVAFLPNDETYDANLSGAMEMKARGAFIIGISFQANPVFDFFVKVTDAGPATIIPNIITGQLLAYYLTLARDLDPDKPRNLAKSVTVK